MTDARGQAGAPAEAERGAAVSDPPPFATLNEAGTADILLVCDHASNALPAACGALGLDPELLRRHIAFDIGAADITRRMSKALDAPAVLSGYSRLLIDCNRRPGHATSIPAVSDGIGIPGNERLDAAEIERRQDAYFHPFHEAVDAALARFAARGVVPAYVAVHTFTPVMDGYERPWHLGILWNRDPRLARPLIAALSEWPDVVVGDNRPYSGRDSEGYSIHAHGGDRGIPHVLVEVRQDLVDTRHGAELWAARVGRVVAGVVEREGPFDVERY